MINIATISHRRSVRLPRVSTANVTTASTIFAIYICSGLTVQAAVFSDIGLSAAESARWLFVIWVTTGAMSIVSSIGLRQPVTITVSMPALVFMASAGKDFTLAELFGANVAAGLAAILIGATGLSGRLARIIPAPVVFGTLAGTMFTFIVTAVFKGLETLPLTLIVAGVFVVARLVIKNAALSLLVALVTGTAISAVTGRIESVEIATGAPDLSPVQLAFTWNALLSIGLPVLLLTAGMTNLQTFAVLKDAGYRVRTGALAVLGGLTGVLNSALGGHASATGGTISVVAVASDGSPLEERYKAVVLASIPTTLVGLVAVPVISLVGALPATLLSLAAALVLVSPMHGLMKKAISAPGAAFAAIAFAVVAAGFPVFGLPPAFLAISGTSIFWLVYRRLRKQAISRMVDAKVIRLTPASKSED